MELLNFEVDACKNIMKEKGTKKKKKKTFLVINYCVCIDFQ